MLSYYQHHIEVSNGGGEQGNLGSCIGEWHGLNTCAYAVLRLPFKMR